MATAACLLTMLAGAACDPIDTGAGSPFGADPTPPAAHGENPAAALNDLASLRVAPWGSMANYSRDRFKHWISQGGGCDTRDEVLKRDGSHVTVGADCKITGGTWVSPYDGKSLTDPAGLDIDHLVPLADAWRTGAAAWSDEKREQFANDLTRPQLVAVTANSNRSKGDQDPSQWRPEEKGYWCAYASSWVAVKAYWQLTVTSDEKNALTEMLGTC